MEFHEPSEDRVFLGHNDGACDHFVFHCEQHNLAAQKVSPKHINFLPHDQKLGIKEGGLFKGERGDEALPAVQGTRDAGLIVEG
ncbi:MAG: hypothetical protein ACP5LK_06330 [Candidatus Bipolaricaulaceae bacterium]